MFDDYIDALPIQTLTDELKRDIKEVHSAEVETSHEAMIVTIENFPNDADLGAFIRKKFVING